MKWIIGLTATSPDDMDSFESLYLKQVMKIQLLDPKIEGYINLDEELPTCENFTNFFRDTPFRGKLVYVAKKDRMRVDLAAADKGYVTYDFHNAEFNYKKIKPNQVLVVLKDDYAGLMRGLDYCSSKPDGALDLLIAAPFESLREYRQALMRVGRKSNKCIRLRLEGTEKVDTNDVVRRESAIKAEMEAQKAKQA